MGSLHVQGLGKAYKQYSTRSARLLEWLLPWSKVRHQLHWVLKDVSFRIAAGESVGLIGINGAGKSTLLKLITGTTQPSTGSVGVHGRVAALLELGMGFHPDFSGRENVLIAGQLLGLTVAEVSALMPEILAFADIGDYIEQPVRVYSSGMQMRLAFSVATCVRPDILIVDEALAVGDVFFQQKCFDRIAAFKQAGTTLLFVSHSAGTILSICDRCLFLRNGVLAFDGAPVDAIDLYQAELLGRSPAPPVPSGASAATPAPAASDAPALAGKSGSITSPAADCIGVRLFDADGQERQSLLADHTVTLQIDYRLNAAAADPHVGFKLRNRYGSVMFETNTYCMHQQPGPVAAGATLSVRFVLPMHLFPDEYTITVGLGDGGYGEGSFEHVLNYLTDVSNFVVLTNPDAIIWSGLVNLTPQLHFTKS